VLTVYIPFGKRGEILSVRVRGGRKRELGARGGGGPLHGGPIWKKKGGIAALKFRREREGAAIPMKRKGGKMPVLIKITQKGSGGARGIEGKEKCRIV